MRFEVEVDADLDALNKARLADKDQAVDVPSFVQLLMDRAVIQVLLPLGPSTLPQALARIAELEQQLAKASAVPAPIQAVAATPP